MNGYAYKALQGRLGDDEIAVNPWASPASLRIKNREGLFKGLHRTLVVAGGTENAMSTVTYML